MGVNFFTSEKEKTEGREDSHMLQTLLAAHVPVTFAESVLHKFEAFQGWGYGCGQDSQDSSAHISCTMYKNRRSFNP